MRAEREALYALVARIPYGRVTTYGWLAYAVGMPRGARQVGRWLARTPTDLALPAHRVIRHDGSMAGGDVFGGAEAQLALLAAEGVPPGEDGRIDLDRFCWPSSAVRPPPRVSKPSLLAHRARAAQQPKRSGSV
ncbi:MAG: MGMT family protein [Chloroflexi bacterium]|nr:MGMT family protein [Chloroflexota bacterium]